MVLFLKIDSVASEMQQKKALPNIGELEMMVGDRASIPRESRGDILDSEPVDSDSLPPPRRFKRTDAESIRTFPNSSTSVNSHDSRKREHLILHRRRIGREMAAEKVACESPSAFSKDFCQQLLQYRHALKVDASIAATQAGRRYRAGGRDVFSWMSEPISSGSVVATPAISANSQG